MADRKHILQSLPLIYRLPEGTDPEEDIATNPNYSDEEFIRDYTSAASGKPLPEMSPDAFQMTKQQFIEMIQQELLKKPEVTPTQILVPGKPIHYEGAPAREKPLIDKYQRPNHEDAVIAALRKLKEEELV